MKKLHPTEEAALRSALIRFHFNVGVYNLDDMKRDTETYSLTRLLREASEMAAA